MQGFKGFTAREANRMLGRAGTFWQDESFDHWIREEADYARTVAYIDMNPVVAGLCATPAEWPWSSAADERGAGDPGHPEAR
jgi:putative DNA methylase